MGTEKAIGPALALEDNRAIGNPIPWLEVVLTNDRIATDLSRAATDKRQSHKYGALRGRFGNAGRLWSS